MYSLKSINVPSIVLFVIFVIIIMSLLAICSFLSIKINEYIPYLSWFVALIIFYYVLKRENYFKNI